MLRSEDWWEDKTIYAMCEGNTIDCVDILYPATVLPFKTSNTFVRSGVTRALHSDSNYDQNMWQLLNWSFTEEEKLGAIGRQSFELSALKLKPTSSIMDCTDSFPHMYYSRSPLQVFPHDEISLYLNFNNLTFYQGIMDQRPKHTLNIERTLFLYYRKTEIIA